MADFYDDMTDFATEMLTEFDQGPYTLSRPGTSTPGANPWDVPTPGTPQTWTIYGIAEPVENKYVDGSLILSTDKQMMIAAFAGTPQRGDMVSDGTQTLTVVRADPVTDRACAWTIFLRG